MCGNDRDVYEYTKYIFGPRWYTGGRTQHDNINIILYIYISRLHRCTASVGLVKAHPKYYSDTHHNTLCVLRSKHGRRSHLLITLYYNAILVLYYT